MAGPAAVTVFVCGLNLCIRSASAQMNKKRRSEDSLRQGNIGLYVHRANLRLTRGGVVGGDRTRKVAINEVRCSGCQRIDLHPFHRLLSSLIFLPVPSLDDMYP